MKKRINIFNQIHKGLRAMLYECAMSLQLTDFTDIESTALTILKVEEVLNVFGLHAQSEDKFILPVVERHNQSLVKEFDSEHEKDEFMTHRLHSLIKVYRTAYNEDARIEAGESIIRAFNEFIAFNLYHMNKEEEKLNPVLWLNYCDDEIKAIQSAIVQSISPEIKLITCRWMMKGNSDAEVIAWLKELKYTAPCFVLDGLMTLAEKVLPAPRWESIQHGLTEGIQLA